MSRSPAFSFYPKDFYLDTAHLTAEEVGVYVRLLMRQWVEPLTENREDLSRIAGLSLTRFTRVWKRVSAHFPPHPAVPGAVANPRLEDERAKQLARSSERRKAGKTGADLRWHRDGTGDGPAMHLPIANYIANDSFAVAVAVAGKAKAKTTILGNDEKTVVAPDGFEDFWGNYPSRGGRNSRTEAMASYRSRLKEGVPPAVILAAVLRYAAFCRATDKVGTEYVQQAKNWLGPKSRGWTETWDSPRDREGPAFPNYPKFDNP